MSFLDTDNGRKFFNQYLKKVNGGSQRVYRSEIQQFFDFLVETHSNASLQGITEDVLHAYQEKLSGEHSPKTTKRKFSILNGFFKHLEHERVKGQQKLWIVDRKGRFQNRPKTGIILNGKALQAFDAWLDIVKGYGIKLTGELPIVSSQKSRVNALFSKCKPAWILNLAKLKSCFTMDF